MRKIMKTYGQGIMAVLGSVLMLAFALPTVFNGDGNSSGMQQGTLAGKKVTLRDIQMAKTDLDVLDEFRMTWLFLYAQAPTGNGYLGLQLDERDPAMHFFLLLAEARKYGLYAADADIDEVIRETPVDGAPLTEEQIRLRLQKIGVPMVNLREAIRHALMVRRLGHMALAATQVSVPSLESLADSALSEVQVNYAILDAGEGWQKMPDPTAQQIQTQFDRYKGVEPLSSQPEGTVPPTIDGHTYPFGYKYPDRVEVEWLKFDQAQVRSLFKPTEQDYEAAYEYYQAHKEEFVRAPATQPATAPTTAPATQIATQPATAPASQPATQAVATAPAFETFDEVKERLVQQQVHQRADKLLDRMVDRAVGMAGEPWKTTGTDAQGFHDALPPAKWASYATVADELAARREFQGYKPSYAKTTAWRDRAGLEAEQGIGMSHYDTQKQTFGFSQLALKVKELDPETGSATRTLAARLGLQVGVEGPILIDSQGDRYVYRVVAADPTHNPPSLEDVKPAIINDLKMLALYQQQQAEAKTLAATAATAPAADLLTVARQRGLVARQSESFSRLRAAQEDHLVAAVPGLVDAAFSLAESAPARSATSQPASAPSSQPSSQPASRNAASTLTDDAAMKVYVVALNNYTPTTPTLFSLYRRILYGEQAFTQQADFLARWSGLEEVARRLDFKPTTPFAAKKSAT